MPNKSLTNRCIYQQLYAKGFKWIKHHKTMQQGFKPEIKYGFKYLMSLIFQFLKF